MEPLPMISVIIPVYNVRAYLDKCIKSILNQTYKYFEIILIDDGSSDGSSNTCDLYAEKYSNVRVKHQENAGAAAARNAGLDLAKSPYIAFIDADDHIEKDMFMSLINDIEENNADIGICNVFIDTGNSNYSLCSISALIVLDKIHLLKMYFEGKCIQSCPCPRVYRKDIIGNTRFPVGALYEDVAFNYEVFSKCEKAIFHHEPKYHYVIRDDSTMHSNLSMRMLERASVWQEVYDKVAHDFPPLKPDVAAKFYQTCFGIMLDIGKAGFNKETREIFARLMKDIKLSNIIKNSMLSSKIKFVFILSKCKLYPLFAKAIVSCIHSY